MYTGNVSGWPGWFDGEYGNLLFFARFAGPTCDADLLTPVEVHVVDQKMDDGKPGTGNLRTWPNTTCSAPCATTNVAATALYSTSDEAHSCVLLLPEAFR
jgi:hypothetical protein